MLPNHLDLGLDDLRLRQLAVLIDVLHLFGDGRGTLRVDCVEPQDFVRAPGGQNASLDLRVVLATCQADIVRKPALIS